MFARCKKPIYRILPILLFSGLIFIAGKPRNEEEGWKWVQRLLLQAYNQSSDGTLKKWNISVTPDGFFRLKKDFPAGKQEYYSFNFKRLKQIDYIGTSASGDILFNTIEDDIIVQTFNDPNGNIDSMSTVLRLPVLNMELQQLDSLRTVLLTFKK